MRILIRTSNWAIWSLRLGSLALPLTVVPVLLHRERYITSDQFVATEFVALAIAAAAVIAAFGAFGRLWVTGDQGWRKAVGGLLFGAICLAPMAWYGYLAYRYPLVHQVATDFDNPLPLVTAGPPPATAAERIAVARAFPDARDRIYPVDATQVFALVLDLIGDRDWDVQLSRAPQTAEDAGDVNAIATNLLGWRSEVAVRVAGTAQGARVSMESVPLYGFHDFGDNGRRVESFLQDLDDRIGQMLRDAPTATGTLDLGGG